MTMRAFYFGCWDQPGHHLWHRGSDGTPMKMYDMGAADRRLLGGRPHSSEPGNGEIPWGYSLDGGLLKGRSLRQGEAVVEQREGWTAISFWDYSVDSRGGSSSTFVFDALLDPEQALVAAREAFPPIFERFEFEVTLAPHNELGDPAKDEQAVLAARGKTGAESPRTTPVGSPDPLPASVVAVFARSTHPNYGNTEWAHHGYVVVLVRCVDWRQALAVKSKLALEGLPEPFEGHATYEQGWYGGRMDLVGLIDGDLSVESHMVSAPIEAGRRKVSIGDNRFAGLYDAGELASIHDDAAARIDEQMQRAGGAPDERELVEAIASGDAACEHDWRADPAGFTFLSNPPAQKLVCANCHATKFRYAEPVNIPINPRDWPRAEEEG